MKREFWFVSSVVSVLTLGFACSTEAPDPGNAAGGGGNLVIDASAAGTAPSSDGAFDPDAACGVGSAEAHLAPVSLMVMFDRSGSMLDEVPAADQSRWEMATTALNGFFQDPGAAGISVALRFFPHDSPNAGCNGEACDATACATPLVELGALTPDMAPADVQEMNLLAAVESARPERAGQGTPTSVALDGALDWAAAQKVTQPEQNAVVILVTDGEANGCDEEITNIAQLAANALTTSGIRTYAIGLTGSLESDVDAIALAGGTEKGIFISDSAEAEQQLLDALNAIRGQILACDFPMPQAIAGQTTDPKKINVNYTSGGGAPVTLGQVQSAELCADAQGWYYDDPQHPTRVHLCPAACDVVVADPSPKLDILLGCVTETVPPPT